MSEKKILILHREYRTRGGEEAFIKNILEPSLLKMGFKSESLMLPALQPTLKNLAEIGGMALGLEGVRPSLKTVLTRARQGNFTHVLINNFAPVISLNVISSLKAMGLKTVLWLHNSRLECANGLHFNGLSSCNKCTENGSRWALIQNCQKNLAQSFLYSLAYRAQRIPKKVIPFVDLFICNSHYTEKKLHTLFQHSQLQAKSVVIPMPIPKKSGTVGSCPPRIENLLKSVPRPFYLFLGRVTFDKGADFFATLAEKYPERGFVMCGEGPMVETLEAKKLSNLVFLGLVGETEKPWLFKNCEALIIPSRSPETSSLVLAESHPYGTPVVYPAGGGAEETFRALKKTGCSLEEFKGQTFSKSEGFEAFNFDDFANKLGDYLGSL